jgi:hypothetical protein
MGALDILAAVSGGLYLVTMTGLGIRLLLLSRRNGTKAELWLAIAFLAGGSFGASAEVIGARFVADPGAAFWLVGLGKLTSAIGLRFYDWFCWRVFRPSERWAGALFFGLAAGAALAVVLFFATGTLERGADRGWFWLELVVRVGSPIWLTAESLRFWSQMRRRVAVGLADPLVTDRFRLWATGALSGLVMLLCSVPPQILPMDHPFQKLSLLTLGVMGLAATAAYWFAFFPPEWYRSRVAARV